jgi:hypothetical protein
MTRVKYIIFILVIFIMTDCRKSQNNLNPLIIGDWQLFQVYEGSWTTVPINPPLTISFHSNGEYAIAYDGKTTCDGNFMFKNSNSLKLSPTGCMPTIESEETIYTLTNDTLTLSNKSLSFSSFYGRKDKYIKIK